MWDEERIDAAAASFFGTIPREDYLRFWPKGTLDPQRVVRFLELTKGEVARIAEVSTASVRFDRKAPKSVVDRLREIATVCSLVAQFFGGDVAKTALWFNTRNPFLADLSPRDMIRQARFEKLRTFVLDALAGTPESDSLSARVAPATENISAAEIPRVGRDHPLIAPRLKEIADLCRRHDVRKLALFGSILRADFDPRRSDIDVLVEFAPHSGQSPARQYFDFKAALEKLFGRPVDLVERSALPDSRLRRIIERTQVPLYAQAA